MNVDELKSIIKDIWTMMDMAENRQAKENEVESVENFYAGYWTACEHIKVMLMSKLPKEDSE